MSEDQRQEMKLDLVRRLAWLLKGDISSIDSTSPDNGTTPMYLLHCQGYHDLGGANLSLVYNVPASAGTATTLHDWITRGEEKEQELMERGRKVRKREKIPKLSSRERWEILKKYKTLDDRKELERERNRAKPNLSSRFFLAWALESTLYNIHASGWVHKGTCPAKSPSSGIPTLPLWI